MEKKFINLLNIIPPENIPWLWYIGGGLLIFLLVWAWITIAKLRAKEKKKSKDFFTTQDANKEVIKHFSKLIDAHPTLSFGQILVGSNLFKIRFYRGLLVIEDPRRITAKQLAMKISIENDLEKALTKYGK